MNYPNPIKQRNKVEPLTGIKSSISVIRPTVSLLYLIYLASGRKSRVQYCNAIGEDKIVFDKELLDKIRKILGNNEQVESLINNNPLVTNQFEPLYVGITLFFRFGLLKMEGRAKSAEREQKKRYPKQIEFASNIVLLDLLLCRFPEQVRNNSLLAWLNNNKSTTADFEESICSFLTICTELAEFKLWDENENVIYFQTEGLYTALTEGKKDLTLKGSKEVVGATRIYRNFIKDNLDPWIKEREDKLYFDSFDKPTGVELSNIISTTLDISCFTEDKMRSRAEIGLVDDNWIQKIYYGTPGSGKSWVIKRQFEMSKDENGECVEDEEKKKHVIRTTFHPDTDYASFVGCYKPLKDKNNKVTYEFVPQAFTDAYVKAWSNTGMYYLIIEEINRGNCAQIFGDLFQLLDRNKDGHSEYPIKADHDLKEYLLSHLPEDSEGIRDGKLCLPPNLSIIASMNTSDQSLFPMDSAFKRRWTWEYVPINYNNEKSGEFTFKIGDNPENWHEFLEAVNNEIKKVTASEDKQMGNFFIKNSIDEKEFCDKVMFYLWSEVGKDNYKTSDAIFKWRDEKGNDTDFSFNELYPEGENRTKILKGFIKYIKEIYKQENTAE